MSGSTSSPHAAAHEPTDAPLGLTVHALPTPQEVVGEQRTRRGRWKMLLVMLVCAAPVLASYFTYYVVRPEGRRNYGELIEPQRDMPTLTARNLAGQPVDLSSLKGQWLLVSVAGGACDAACQKHLYLQRQLRETLGRDKDRLDWVWLIDDQAPVDAALQNALVQAKAQAQALRVDREALTGWLAPASGRALSDHLYVVDPMGRWMMRFAPIDLQRPVDTESAGKIKRDLERLMRASASWDHAGR